MFNVAFNGTFLFHISICKKKERDLIGKEKNMIIRGYNFVVCILSDFYVTTLYTTKQKNFNTT